MKNNRLLSLVLVVVLILVASGLAINEAVNNMNLGLDLRGGVYVLYQAVETDEGVRGDDKIDRAITIIRNRIDGLGVAEPVIQREGEDRIRIELPGIADQQAAHEVIGRTAMLEFVGPDEEVILTGGDLRDAQAIFDQRNRPAVSLEFNPEGTRKFAEATERYIGRIIAIYLDDEAISTPVVEAVIADGQAIITGNMTLEEAGNLALMLRSGALPVQLVELETRSVGPQLGRDSLDRSVRAGLAGLILVLLYMLIAYRAFGLVANIALIAYMAILFGILAAMNATMTLFGIAGLILSVGLAVDANVIIFERIKEELAAGRSMRTSVEAGFERALRAILDANVTTLIAAAVLFQFASGPIRGFAVTLSAGILASMLTAILLTRFLLRQWVKADVLKTSATVPDMKVSKWSIVGLRKFTFIFSALLILAGALSLGTNSLNYGIDFTGGTLMHINIGEEFSLDEAREVLVPLELEGSTLQRVGLDGMGEEEAHELVMRSVELSSAERDEVFAAFQARYNLTGDDLLRAESVGAIVGSELQRQALWALLIAGTGMILYITLRFEFRFALTAIAALLHDAMIVLALFSVLQIEVNGPFIAAILTILGYSINDTIVIYDRIRENLKNRRKENLGEVVDNSVNQSLRRSFNTSVTTLLVLLTIYAFGGITLRPFISALIAGVVVGTYSSIFVASPLWLAWKESELRKQTSANTA